MAMFNEDKNLKSGGCADEIAALIRDDLSPKMIQEQLENYHNSDIAKSMEQMDRLGRMRLIRSIEPDKLAGIFKYVEPQEAAAFLKDIDTARAVFILEKIDPDAAADILRELPGSDRSAMIGLLNGALRKKIELLVLGMVVSGVVGAFEKVVSRLTIIMAFQSLILDMAGNVGTQSLAVTIRVLMDKEITARKKLGLVCKEMRVGLFSGLILGSLSVLFVGAYIMLGKGYPAQYAFAVSVCIGAALLLAMFISSAVGTLIPMFFKRIGVDPAVASGPLITTVNDLVAVVTYYGLSWLLLLQVLHLGS